MKVLPVFLSCVLAFSAVLRAEPTALFDGKSFEGWEGDTKELWRVEDGVITAGSLDKKVPRNEFLVTKKTYADFELRLKFKLTGTEGFVNSGIMIRSVRIDYPPGEMRGYQADIGDGFWGALYDECRRNKILVAPPKETLKDLVKKGDWNEYRIRCEGRRIQLWLNGVQTVDYTEPDESIPQDGHIGLQIHGDGKTVVAFKDIEIEELSTKAR